MKLVVAGGHQRAPAGTADRSHRALYDRAVLAVLDVDAGTVEPWVSRVGPGYGVDPSAIGHRFGALSRDRDAFVACTEREVLRIDRSGGVRATVSHPWFADVHAAFAQDNGGLGAVATGIDAVVFVAADGGARSVPVGDAVTPPTGDLRAVVLPRARWHPNHAVFVDGEAWVTRGRTGDVVVLGDAGPRGAPVVLADVVVHDGTVTADGLWFTRVDGALVLVDPATRQVVRTVHLAQPDDGDEPLGWCRGLAIVDDTAFVGFTRLRATRLRANLAWIRGQLRGKPHATRRPTRIEAYDLRTGRRIGRWISEAAGIDAVFGLLPW